MEVFWHYLGKSISISLPLTYRFVYMSEDKFAYSDPNDGRFYALCIHD